MQPKESKTSFHFWVSFFKSLVRMVAALALIGQNFVTAGISFLIAEMLGIIEEL